MATLEQRLVDLITRVGTEFKSVRTAQGTLSSLTTTAKASLVAAINELDAEIAAIAGSSSGINDATTGTSTTWSSTKIDTEIDAAVAALVASAPAALNTLNELATALGNDSAFATTITTALGKRVRFDASQTLTSGEKTQALTNIGAAPAADIGNPDRNLVTDFETALV